MNATSQHQTTRLRAVFQTCRTEARLHERNGNLDAAWASLVAAHILGQRSTALHVRSHALMFGLAWRTRDRGELMGQISRVIGAALVTWIWVPEGNTGRANVSAFKRMPVPGNLRSLMVDPSEAKRSPDE
jgi:hypothetical protein